MTVQNEVAWLLDIIRTNYPVTWPDDLARRNRDDSVTLDKPDAPVRENGVELTEYNVVGVSTGDKNRELLGTKPQYDVETTLDVRIEAINESEFGRIADDDAFKTLVAYIQHAINQELTYPAVDTGDEDIGRVVYKDLGIIDEQNLSSDDRDFYRRDFSVRLRGFQDTP